MASWDLWIDHHRRDTDGLTHGNVRNARAVLTLTPGTCVIVGNDEADDAVAEILRLEENGVVLPGSVDDNRGHLEPGPTAR